MKIKFIGVSGAVLGVAVIALLLPGRMQGRQSNATADETAGSNNVATSTATTTPAVSPEPAALPTAPAAVSDAQTSPPGVTLSKGATDIARFAQSGIGQDVMLAYINNAKDKFALGSDQIVYLNDLGIPGTVVKAMIERDASLDAISQAEAAKQAQAWQPQPQPPVTLVDTNPVPPPPTVDNTYPPEPLPTDDTAAQLPLPDPTTDAAPDDSDYFYTSLAPYGSWIYVAGCGVCWQPTVCRGNHDWRPYCDRGRWIYSDCGWYWQSDYSWGWAAFHYGRWYEDPHHGWVWHPEKVWGPAWVSWRASGDYCGWAPLPPSAHFVPGKGFVYGGHPIGAGYEFGLRAHQYTFIPLARLSDYAPSRYSVASWQTEEIRNQTHVITQITEQNHHLVSRGVDPQQVASLANTQIRRAEILEVPHNGSGSVQSDRLGKRGDNLVIYRPQLPAPTPRPVNGSTPTSHPSHNFGGPRTSTSPAAPETIHSTTTVNAASATPMPQASATAAATAKANNDALVARIMAIKAEGMAHQQAEAKENYPQGSYVWRGNDSVNYATSSVRPETPAQPAHVPPGNYALHNTFGQPNNSEQHVSAQHPTESSSSVFVIPGRQNVAQHQNANVVPYWMNTTPAASHSTQSPATSSYAIPGRYTATDHFNAPTLRNESSATYSTHEFSHSTSTGESHTHFESHSTPHFESAPASHESYSSHSSSSGGGSSSGGSSHSSSSSSSSSGKK